MGLCSACKRGITDEEIGERERENQANPGHFNHIIRVTGGAPLSIVARDNTLSTKDCFLLSSHELKHMGNTG